MAPLGPRDLENTQQSSRMGKATRLREKLVQRKAQDKRRGEQDRSSKQLCHTEERSGETRLANVGRARSQASPTPDSHTGPGPRGSDVKEACVLLELEDSNLFPAHLPGWLTQQP